MGGIQVRYFVTKKRKGKERYYWQPKKKYLLEGKWKPCPLKTVRLQDNPSAAFAQAEELNKALDAWRAGEDKTHQPGVHGSFDWLIVEYKASDWFKDLGERTKKEYGYILEDIRKALLEGNIINAPAAAYTRQHARMLHHKFRDTPRKAQLVAALARIVFNYGIEIGELKENPFDKMKIRKRPKREIIWLDFEHENPLHLISAMKMKAEELGLKSISMAIDLAIWTAQREGDILSLPWGKYNGAEIRLRQSKSKVWVSVPVMPQLKKGLDNWDKVSPVILISERTGNPFHRNHFGEMFREVRIACGIDENLQFRDLRKTSIVMLALAGCSDTEITAISGHTNAEVSGILETYLPRNSEMAKNAIKKMKKLWKESA